jgi:hypothetical protein
MKIKMYYPEKGYIQYNKLLMKVKRKLRLIDIRISGSTASKASDTRAFGYELSDSSSDTGGADTIYY